MMRQMFVVLVAVFCCVFGSMSAWAGGLCIVGPTGTTDVANGSDPWDIWFPHNLGSKLQLKGESALKFGAVLMAPRFKYEDRRGRTLNSKKGVVHLLPSVSYAEWLDDYTVWGVDVDTHYGMGASFADVKYGMDSETLVSGTYTKLYLSHQFSEQWSAGIGPTLVMGMMDWYGPLDIARRPLPVRVGLEAIGFGVGWQVGVMYQPNERFAIGLNYLSPVTTHLEGRCTVGALGLSVRDAVDLEFRFPEKVDLSLGYQPNGDWLIVAQASYFGYSQNTLDQVKVDFDKLMITKPVNLGWQDNLALSLGISHHLNDRWTVGGGVTYMTKAIGKTADFMTPDMAGWAVATRVKYSPNHKFSVIASVTYGWGENEQSGRKMSVDIVNVGVSAGWTF